MRDTFVATLTEIAAADERVILLTGDLGFGVLTDYSARYPRQFLNVGVAEQNLAGIATGLALEGRIVFTYSIANFPTLRCLEQIRNDACYHEANVKIVSIGGGFSYGALGISHHATEDLAILRALPNMSVVAPSDRWEVRQATRALCERPGTALLRLDRAAAETNGTGQSRFQLGRARRLREGADVTLVATGGITAEALEASRKLSDKGIECRVLSMHTVKPLDVDSLKQAALETGGIITIEEHTVDGGLGGAVAENLLEEGLAPGFFHRIGLRSGFASIVGSQDYLRSAYGMDAAAIVAAATGRLKMRCNRREVA
jgi:transketolase